MRAVLLLRGRHMYLNNAQDISTLSLSVSIRRNISNRARLVRLMNFSGRGREIEELVDAIHVDFRSELDRLRRVAVKLNLSTLRDLSLKLLKESGNGIYGECLTKKQDGIRRTRYTYDWCKDLRNA